MGVPKTIRQLNPKGAALALTDLFAICAPSPAITDAVHVTAQDIVTLVGAVVAAGNNGLMNNGAVIQWGQPFGQAGDPAALLHSIEIPDTGQLIFFGKNDGVADVIAFDILGGQLQISNQSGSGGKFVIFDSQDYSFQSDGSGTLCKIGFNSGNNNLAFDSTEDSGAGGAVLPVVLIPERGFIRGNASLTGAVNVITRASGFFNKCDSSGGNVAVQINPVTTEGANFIFKKTSGDVNTITITPTSGTIQELGAPAANFIFGNEGESISVYSDGTNLFVY